MPRHSFQFSFVPPRNWRRKPSLTTVTHFQPFLSAFSPSLTHSGMVKYGIVVRNRPGPCHHSFSDFEVVVVSRWAQLEAG